MIEFNFDKNCAGCKACINICPKKAISIRIDKLGFEYPVVDIDKCVNCGLCDRVCPHINGSKPEDNVEIAYIYSSQSDNVANSASGGAFFEMAKYMLNLNGYVSGCVWDETLSAKHIVSNCIDDVYRMQGSKYVQSDISGIYKSIGDLLKSNQHVLFCGTSCQVKALDLYVSVYVPEKRENLVTVAIICHGVSSDKVWKSYKCWLEKKYASQMVAANFRDKTKKGYRKTYCSFKFDNGRTIYMPTYLPPSKYIESTLVYNLGVRESCANCDCKGFIKGCDIIIGDYHSRNSGVGKMGTSCVIPLSKVGREYIECCLNGLEQIDIKTIISENTFMLKSIKISDNKARFIEEFDGDIWSSIEKFYPKKYIIKKIMVYTGLYDVLRMFKVKISHKRRKLK